MKAERHQEQEYIFPDQSSPHEATWLQWPHHHTYGHKHQQKLEPVFVQIVKCIITSEIARIIVYDQNHKEHVIKTLGNLTNIQYFIYPTDDIWVRDNGPIFARNKRTQQLVIQRWGFNGWGQKAPYKKCAKIPKRIAQTLNFKVIDLRDQMVNQGGSVQIDGKGVMFGCESSIFHKKRNKGLRKKDAQEIFQAYYGVKKFIWLEGVIGEDITDCHIDGFLKMIDGHRMLTFCSEDLHYWGISKQDIKKIKSATNIQGKPYEIIEIPLTKFQLQVQGRWLKKKKLGKGSYLNFYICNKAILVPVYGDPHDQIALKMIQSIYPDRKVHGIMAKNLFAEGGMIHCVTQQQPYR